jgi:two-component sensor histidine kinase
VAAPVRKGFGTRLIERSLALELAGEVRFTYETPGLVCRVIAPLDADGASPTEFEDGS